MTFQAEMIKYKWHLFQMSFKKGMVPSFRVNENFDINLFFFQIGSKLAAKVHTANNSAGIFENEGKRTFQPSSTKRFTKIFFKKDYYVATTSKSP